MGSRGYDHLLKFLLIGDSSVGKTSLLIRYADQKFSNDVMSTIGIDFKVKTIRVNNKLIKLQIWDTAGQEKYHTITTAYYRGSHGVMMVYDVTNIKSFDSIERWSNNVKNHADDDARKIIVGNKCDMDEKRLISTYRGQELALSQEVDFIETSASTGENVEKAFETLVKRCLDHLESRGELHGPQHKNSNQKRVNIGGSSKNFAASDDEGSGGCC